MKKLRWQIIIGILALAAVVLLILGQSQVGDTISQMIEPATGGVYVEALIGKPIRFNPLLDHYNQVDQDIDRLLFSRMIRFDSWGNPQPELAESFGVAVTGDIFNVKLRENAYWHDGTPVTTADVIFTIELMRNAEMPLPPDVAALWNSVEVVTLDAWNIQFRLPSQYSPFIDYLSFGILPKHILEGKSPQEIVNDPYNLLPVGSGPYQIGELLTEDEQITGIVLEAFEDYYLGQPYLDQIVVQYYDTTQDAFDAFQRGEVLGIGKVQPDVIDEVLAEPGLNVFSVRVPEQTIIFFNLGENGPLFLEDLEVRQALMMALNRPWMIDTVMDGQAVLSNSPIMVGSWAYFADLESYDYSPQEAIKLLRQQGYTLPADGSLVRQRDGAPLSFELVYPDTETFAQLAEMVQEYWREVGVEVSLVAVQPEVLVRDYLDTGLYDAALVSISLTNSPDPDPYPFWHQAMIVDGQNYSRWDDMLASEYLEKARITPNRTERARLYRSFQIHFSRQLPALPLFSSVYNYAIDSQVFGVQLGPLYDPADRFDHVLNWSLEGALPIEETPVPGGDTE
ncbi:MAG TPA: peptide ABC transporter substrate-binding protein [Anaerolineales bacterium]|nr:peptide ABC transporter substrate-binding protein [Anaerolineales bacterium]